MMDERHHDQKKDKQGKEARAGWMIDKKIPIALVVTLAIQTVVFSAWFAAFKATTEINIAQLKEKQSVLSDTKIGERLVRVETLLDTQREVLARIEARLPPASGRTR